MSEQNKGQPLAVFHREVFVTNAPAGVHIRYQAPGANACDNRLRSSPVN